MMHRDDDLDAFAVVCDYAVASVYRPARPPCCASEFSLILR